MPDVVFDQRYYAETYFLEKNGSHDPVGTCTLLTRRIVVKRYDSGAVRVFSKTDGEDFPDEDAMVRAIEERQMRELPWEQWRDREWLPPEAEVAREFWKAPA